MAAINDLIQQIQDPDLRERIQKEVDKLFRQKKFGLVFESHLPEYTPLYDMPIKIGCNIMLKNNKDDKSVYTVLDLKEDMATCCNTDFPDETLLFPVGDIVRIAEFGEPIYPYLKPVDTVCNAPDSDLWHTLIEADNYHALQLLEYLYAGKVDCIYIDPPYNTGARDWKYNNDYVDGNDAYRHSKWLSMMEKRLKIAKRLLNPDDSVLIVTIDEKEYLHLGCLLEEMFSDANIQMISTLTAGSGAARFNSFSRVNEFIFFVMVGNYTIFPIDDTEYQQKGDEVHWSMFRRGDIESQRGMTKGGVAQFYPIYVNDLNGRIEKIGEPIRPDIDINDIPQIDGCTAVFPIRDDGTEMNWSTKADTAQKLLTKGYLRASNYFPNKPQKYSIQYLRSGTIADIENGRALVKGYSEKGSIIAENLESRKSMPKTIWTYKIHDARDYGTKILKNTIGEKRFDYPKSLYAVRDALKLFVANKPDALIVDFFAGSGTTLHAVNFLNAEDGGKRRCIMVTNNEVSDAEEKSLLKQGYKPGDEEWEQYGIAQYVTWPRTVCSIEGHNINGESLKGNYLGSEIPMADGFKANAAYFKLGFLDKTSVALGRQFAELLSILWMKAGAIGPCPSLGDDVPDMLILPENKFAVLTDENAFATFEQNLQEHPEIQTVFLVTDYDVNYRSMARSLNVATTYQLYRDYLDNFRINQMRD